MNYSNPNLFCSRREKNSDTQPQSTEREQRGLREVRREYTESGAGGERDSIN